MGADANVRSADLDALLAGRLAGARTLDLSRCGLDDVPRAVFGLADSLESLDLSGNRLKTLPADMGRLTKLRRLFCSGNPFDVLPVAIGDCPALTQIGFRGCALREVPAEALPPALRWLTLTDNRLEHLPAALGERPALRKLMLAGNRLRSLPETMAGAANLELLRISANDFAALPSWLAALPALSWLAFAGNPFETRPAAVPIAAIRWDDLRLGPLLGQGASGHVHAAEWSREDGARQVALKIFKGTMTSDGLPECERAACLAAGPHPHLVAGLGSFVDHPDGSAGLVMPMIPSGWGILASPPDADSCSRDVYAAGFRITPDVAIRIARGIGGAAAHLHANGLLHGDLYAHNIFWDGAAGAARLSDFGAASFMAGQEPRLARLEVRAWGILFGELLARCESAPPENVLGLQRACVASDPASRPTMAEAVDELKAGSL